MNNHRSEEGDTRRESVEMVAADDHLEIDDVLRFLREHNQQANPVLWAKFDDPKFEPQEMRLIARSTERIVLGGLLAETAFAWLKINILAVHDEHRGQGIGRRLVTEAERVARIRGCHYAYVDTMEYQAPQFYERLGYAVVGSISDWDSHGHAKFFLTKTLVEQLD